MIKNKLILFTLLFIFFKINIKSEEYMPQKDFKEIFIKNNNINLYCKVMGKGSPIIILHGGPGFTHNYLFPYLSKLAKKNLIIFYDQRGTGKSDLNDINSQTINIENFLSDLDAIRKYFKLEKLSLLGHSWGSYLALKYALKNQKFIDKLLLVNLPPVSSEGVSNFLTNITNKLSTDMEEVQKIEKSKEFLNGNTLMHDKYYNLIFRAYCFDPNTSDLIKLELDKKSAINGFKIRTILDKQTYGKKFNLYNEFKDFPTKTLIVHGTHDPLHFSYIEKMHEYLSNSKFVLLEECGHFSYLEKQKKLFKEIQSFLND